MSAECSTLSGTSNRSANRLDELRREADFRNQHEGSLTARQRTLHYLQIHLGLAAARDAVENEGAELPE